MKDYRSYTLNLISDSFGVIVNVRILLNFAAMWLCFEQVASLIRFGTVLFCGAHDLEW